MRRLTRRQRCTFSVDSVGNGYAAAIVAETIRGDLGAALDRGKRPVPIDPAFSLTSAAALAHAALLAADRNSMSRALEWSTQGSFPLLAFLTPFSGCCAALLHGAAEDAADLAEAFSDQVTVPVWQVYALPVLNDDAETCPRRSLTAGCAVQGSLARSIRSLIPCSNNLLVPASASISR